MARKRYTAEEIIGKLREAEVALAQGDRLRRWRAASAWPSRPITAGGASTAVCELIKPNG